MISLDVQLKDCAYVEEGSVMISHKNLLTLRWSQSTPCYRMILPLGPEIKFANWFQEKKGSDIRAVVIVQVMLELKRN